MALDNGSSVLRQSRRRLSASTSLTATRRAVIAAALVDRGWSMWDACDLCCVNRTYVAKVRRMSEADRIRLLRGVISLSPLRNGKRSKPTLADMLAVATPSERAEAAARLGPAVVWDEMVSPLIDEERASQAAE
jgi:hypothetical protein